MKERQAKNKKAAPAQDKKAQKAAKNVQKAAPKVGGKRWATLSFRP